eukprot:7361100-Prymnesium_polylepis.2
MGYGRASGWSSGKKKKANSQRNDAEDVEEMPGDAADDSFVDEPPLAQPARKRGVSGEPTRQSRRGKPDPFKPTP